MSRKMEMAPGSAQENLDFRTDAEKRADEERRKAKVVEIIQKKTREHEPSTTLSAELDPTAEKLLKEERESNRRDEIYKHPPKPWRAG